MDTQGSDRTRELYRRYGAVIYARCRRLLKDVHAAEDATQEVFVRVIKHVGNAPDDQAVLAWIYRISMNYCLNVHRDERRRAEALISLPWADCEDPAPGLLDKELAERLLDAAPPALRAPAWLYFVEGCEQRQIARSLGISRRTVINRLNAFVGRSRKRLARELVLD